MTATGDFLAFISLGGGGSWGRASTEEKALELCAYNIRDWRTYFDVLGKDIEVGLYDLTGRDKVHMEGRGVYDTEAEEWVPMLKAVKVHVPTDEELEAKQLEEAQRYITPKQVLEAYAADEPPFISYEIALQRLQQMGYTEKQADDLLLDVD